MFKKEKFFYIDNIQYLDFEYIKKTNAKLIIRDLKHHSLLKYTNFAKKCNNNRISLYIANNTKMLFKLKSNNFYISAKNKNNYGWLKQTNKRVKLIGSAHNLNEIHEKINQGCDQIILSRLYTTNKKGFYGVIKFNLLTLKTKQKIIALGGINRSNYKTLNMINCNGVATLSEPIKKPDFLKG